MILDEKLEFCDAVDVSAAIGTANVGDHIDLEVAGRYLHQAGMGTARLVITVSVAFASGTSSTVQFRLVSDGTTSLATDNNATIHWLSDVFDESELPAGATIIVPLPGGLPAAERYLGLQVVTGGAATTAGTIDAFITLDGQDWRAHANAI